MFRCLHCDLLQRHPLLTNDEYGELYTRSPGDHWSSEQLRSDQLTILAAVHAAYPTGGSVLDVGCAAGEFLAALGPNYEKFGVEPSPNSQVFAVSRGVKILASSIEELPPSHNRFDVITAIDVVEHVANPDDFIGQLLNCLTPGGRIILSTGNSRSLAWKLLGPSFYYSHNYEHITFLSDRWANSRVERPFECSATCLKIRHGDNSCDLKWRMFALGRLLVKIPIATVDRLVGRLVPNSNSRTLGPRLVLGEPGLFRDHFMMTIQPRLI